MKNFKQIWFALALFVIDVFSIGRGFIAIIAIFVVIFRFIPRAIAGAKEKEPVLFQDYLAKSIIYSLMIIAIFFANAYLFKAAKTNSGIVVSALDNYKAKYGQYPEELKQVIPEFLTAIPQAKIDLFGKFSYKKISGTYYALNYVILDPIGKSYDFSNQTIKTGIFKWFSAR